MKSTLPTGKTLRGHAVATPRSEPAHTTAYSGASSQNTSSYSMLHCIPESHQEQSEVEVGEIFFPVISSIDLMSFKGSLVVKIFLHGWHRIEVDVNHILKAFPAKLLQCPRLTYLACALQHQWFATGTLLPRLRFL